MIKRLIYLLSILTVFTASAQSKLLDKVAAMNAPEELEFYSDERLSSPISRITDGTMEFWVKAPITKGKASKAQEYTKVELNMSWDGRREVYRDVRDLGEKLTKVAKGKGYEVFKIELSNEDRADLFFNYVEDSENAVVKLESQFRGGRNRNETLASGVLELDLTSGKEKYIEYLLSKNADYSFDNTDAFKDDDLKTRVITDFENRWDIKIHQFAWGERVPYTGDDLKFYRRHTAGITYTGSDGTCYKAGVSVFDVSATPEGPYSYGNDGSQFNPERIPCERAKL